MLAKQISEFWQIFTFIPIAVDSNVIWFTPTFRSTGLSNMKPFTCLLPRPVPAKTVILIGTIICTRNRRLWRNKIVTGWSKLPTKASLANPTIECALLLTWSTGRMSPLKGKSSDSRRKLHRVTNKNTVKRIFFLERLKSHWAKTVRCDRRSDTLWCTTSSQ